MTKEPADWAKIKAYRMTWPSYNTSDANILTSWDYRTPVWCELARMYDKYEQPPVDPDLLAAREWGAAQKDAFPEVYLDGSCDGDPEIKGFLAGIKHGRANP